MLPLMVPSSNSRQCTPVVGKVQGAVGGLGAVPGRQRLHQRAPARSQLLHLQGAAVTPGCTGSCLTGAA